MHENPFTTPDPDHEPPRPTGDEPSTAPRPATSPGPRAVPDGYDPAAGALLTEHPEPLFTTDGLAVACPACRALRDWLLIAWNGGTWIRCRCGHEWGAPPSLTTDGGEPVPPDRYWDTLDAAITSLGFDGFLDGLYLE